MEGSMLVPLRSTGGPLVRSKPSGINYDKLMEICGLNQSTSTLNSQPSLDHEQFMKEYPLLFLPPLNAKTGGRHRRSLSVQPKHIVTSERQKQARPRSVTSEFLHRQKPMQKEVSILTQRLMAISKITQKHPPLRSSDEIKTLASLLHHFPAFLSPDLPDSVKEGIAARTIAERVTDRRGLALPREGGRYLIIQGRVQEVEKDLESGRYKTKMLYAGDVFGEMKEMGYPPKHSYPIYLGENKCLLVRITVSDMKRAEEFVHGRQLQEQLKVINSSPLLRCFQLNIRQNLARNIQWKHFPIKTKVLQEGEAVTFLTVINNGKCLVTKTVPMISTSVKVCIGEIGEGDCVGELIFDGCEIAPYTVTATTPLQVGQIAVSKILALELDKILPPQRQYAINLPSEEMLLEIYANKQMSRQWSALKRAIVGEVYKEQCRIKSAMS